MTAQIQSNRQWLISFWKGIAIVMVFAVHASIGFDLPPVLKSVFAFGQMGCQIFFVLSSYSLCLSLNRKPQTTCDFMKRRIRRIVPGYWTMIAITFCIDCAYVFVLKNPERLAAFQWYNILANLLLLNGFLPGGGNNLIVRGGWYIGATVIFYLFTPLLFRLFQKENEKWRKIRAWVFPLAGFACAAILIPLAAILSGAGDCVNNEYLYFSFVNQMPCYLLGFSAFDFLQQKKQHCKPVLLSLGLLSLIASILLFFSGIRFAFVVIPTLFSLSFFCLFVVLTETIGSICPEKKSVSLLMKYGDNSFAIYLIHPLIVFDGELVLRKLFSFLPPVPFFFACLLGGLFCVFFLSKVFSAWIAFFENVLKKTVSKLQKSK